jgi:hypothetical protein
MPSVYRRLFKAKRPKSSIRDEESNHQGAVLQASIPPQEPSSFRSSTAVSENSRPLGTMRPVRTFPIDDGFDPSAMEEALDKEFTPGNWHLEVNTDIPILIPTFYCITLIYCSKISIDSFFLHPEI